MESFTKPKLKRNKGKHSSISFFNIDSKKPITIDSLSKDLPKDISESLWKDNLKTKLILQMRMDPLKCDFKNGNVMKNMYEYMLNFSEYKKFNYLRKSIDPHFDWEMEGFCGEKSEVKILYQWNIEKKMCRKLFYPSKYNEKVTFEWQCCGISSRCHKPHLEFFE